MNKERNALILLLDHWETEDIEKKYIFEALELLSTREDLLLNDTFVSFASIFNKICFTGQIIFLFYFYKDLEVKKPDCESASSTSLGSPTVILTILLKKI